MNYFDPREFACKCGRCSTPVAVSPVLLDSLNQLRFLYGKPIVVNSGVRCPEHNARSGGVPDSEHVTGDAVDIRCETSQDRRRLLELALPIFPRVGIDPRFLHLGVSTAHPTGVVWLYPPKSKPSTGPASGSVQLR